MSADYTAIGLITSIQKRGIFPNAQTTFGTADFLRLMDEEMRLHLVTFINSVRENYFTGLYDQSINSGQADYPMPPRAVGMKLKEVYYVDSMGRPFELPRVDIHDLPYLQNPNPTVDGIPRYFYINDNTITLVPSPQLSTQVNTLRLYYYIRRGTLVDLTAVGKVTAINTSTGDLTLNNVPANFTTGQTYDIVKGRPGFQTTAMDLTASSVTTNDIVFTPSNLPSDLVVGDYVALSQESPIAQIPYELFPLLAQRTVASICRAINDLAGGQRADQEVARLEESAIKLLSDRVDENAKKIVSPNNIGQWVWGRFIRW